MANTSKISEIQKYLDLANRFDELDPKVSYQCRFYAMRKGCVLSRENPSDSELRMALGEQMTKLEQTKAQHGGDDGKQKILTLVTLTMKATEADFEKGIKTEETFKNYLTIVNLLDVLKDNDDKLTPDLQQLQKAAKWKATSVLKEMKNPQAPPPSANPAPPSGGFDFPSTPSGGADGFPSTPSGAPQFPSTPSGGFPSTPSGAPSGGFPSTPSGDVGGFPSTPSNTAGFPSTPSNGSLGFPSTPSPQGYPSPNPSAGGFPSTPSNTAGFPSTPSGAPAGYPNPSAGSLGFPSTPSGGPGGFPSTPSGGFPSTPSGGIGGYPNPSAGGQSPNHLGGNLGGGFPSTPSPNGYPSSPTPNGGGSGLDSMFPSTPGSQGQLPFPGAQPVLPPQQHTPAPAPTPAPSQSSSSVYNQDFSTVIGKKQGASDKDIEMATRLSKHAASALQYDDVPTAIQKLEQALALLKK